MANCETYTLPSIEAEPQQVRDILRCLLHTILFNRALGHVKPQEVDCDLLDLSYVCVDDREVHTAVEGGIGDFCSSVEKRPPGVPAQVRLAFYERRQKASWFGTADERMYWEQWFIPLRILSHQEALQRSMQAEAIGPRAGAVRPATSPSALSSCVSEAMGCITRCVSERRDAIPPVVSSAVITYPFDITATMRDPGRASFSLGNVKKMLLQTSPPPMIS